MTHKAVSVPVGRRNSLGLEGGDNQGPALATTDRNADALAPWTANVTGKNRLVSLGETVD